jgi:hypothetical protein
MIGKTRNKHFANDGIYLTTACQLVEYRYVVDTVWSVNNRLCVDIAKSIYKVLS